MLPVPYDANSANKIGINRLTDYVVSSIITAKEYVIRVDPDNMAVAPIIAYA